MSAKEAMPRPLWGLWARRRRWDSVLTGDAPNVSPGERGQSLDLRGPNASSKSCQNGLDGSLTRRVVISGSVAIPLRCGAKKATRVGHHARVPQHRCAVRCSSDTVFRNKVAI